MDSAIHTVPTDKTSPIRKGLSGFALAILTSVISITICPGTTAHASTSESQPSRTPVYIAKPGDTVEGIADRYGLSVSSIQAANDDTPLTTISKGDEVKLPWVPNVLVHPDFSTGGSVRMAALPSLNPGFDRHFDGRFTWPVTGSISSGYGPRRGRMHHGIDIQGPVGTPISAAMGGVVTFAGWDNGGYGYRVDVTHANGYMTRYAHGAEILVRKGQRVNQGHVLMTRGSTGRSTGPHLHFELRHNGVALNPATMLNGNGPLAGDRTGPGGIGGTIE